MRRISFLLLFIMVLFTRPATALESGPPELTATDELTPTITNGASGTTSPGYIGTSSEYEQQMADAIDAFYRSDWDKTRHKLHDLKRQQPEDLRAYFFQAMIPFWSYFFGGGDPAHAREFLDLSNEAIRIGDRLLDVNPADTSTILLMGGLHGYRSLVAASERQYRTAISSGVTGRSFSRVLMSMDDDDPNTLMGQGIFEYMIGSIPREARWIARLAGLSGSIERGFELLEAAAYSESYVSNDASMFLAYFYEQEGRKQDAIRHLERLSAKYPENIIFVYNKARLLEIEGSGVQAKEAYAHAVSLPADHLPELTRLSKERLQALQ